MNKLAAVNIGWDLGKLLIQGGFALIIAKKAVGWALDRFKQEKKWERRLTAQSDIIAALFEMRRLYGRWVDRAELHNDVSAAARAEEDSRFKIAARRLDEASAVGAMLLPTVIRTRLAKLELDREAIVFEPGDLPEDIYNQEYRLIDDAISDLIQQGRDLV